GARDRRAIRPLSRPARVRTARDARHAVLATRVVARLDRPHRARYRVPAPLAPGRSARRERGTAGRRLGERRALLQRARPLPLRRDALERRGVGHTAADSCGDRGGIHHASKSPARLDSRARLGYAFGFRLLERGREAVTALLRPHGLYWYLALDGSGPRPVHHFAHEPCPPHTGKHGDPPGAGARRRSGGRRPHASRTLGVVIPRPPASRAATSRDR